MRACWLVLPPGTRLTAAVLHSAVGRSPVCDGAVPQAWGQDNTWSSPDGCIITHITATPDPDAVYNITVRHPNESMMYIWVIGSTCLPRTKSFYDFALSRLEFARDKAPNYDVIVVRNAFTDQHRHKQAGPLLVHYADIFGLCWEHGVTSFLGFSDTDAAELEPQLDVVDTHSEWEARQAWDDLGKQAFANLRRSMFLEQHPVGIEQVLVKAPGNNQRSGIKQLDSVPEPQEPGVAQASPYIFSSSRLDLSDKDKETGYFCEHIVSNLLASQLSAVPTLSYDWENAYGESRLPYDFVVRHAPSGKEIFINAKGSWLKFKQNFPMSAAEMLKAIEEAGNYNVYCVFKVGRGCMTSLVRILNPAELVRQKELKYRLQL